MSARLTVAELPCYSVGMEATPDAAVERLWQAARFLPQSVRLLGTRYRSLFVAYAQQVTPEGDSPAVADALGFVDFMFRQNRVGLLDPEQRALRRDERALRRRFKLKRRGDSVSAVEKWKILQWLSF
jgi:hypothetical protein